MSRSRKKYCCHGFCSGSNTTFYRERNRSTRRKNRDMLHTLLANMTIDEVGDLIYNITNKLNCKTYNVYAEPTDGKIVAKSLTHYVGKSRLNWLKKYDYDKYIKIKNFFEKNKRK